MLPLLKKSKDKPVLPSIVAWHPDFRDVKRLPDTKVVRTAFFVNGVTISLASASMLYFAYSEYSLHSITKQAAELQVRVDAEKRASDQAAALYKKFQAEEAKLAEVTAFFGTRLPLTQLLAALGDTLPADIAFQSMDLRDTGVTLRGLIRGTSEQASGRASDYQGILKSDPVMSALFSDVTLTSLSRDPGTGRMSLQLFLGFAPVAKAKGAK